MLREINMRQILREKTSGRSCCLYLVSLSGQSVHVSVHVSKLLFCQVWDVSQTVFGLPHQPVLSHDSTLVVWFNAGFGG